MNRNKELARKMFDLQLFAGGTSIPRDDVGALIPVQESDEIIQGWWNSLPCCSVAAGSPT